MIASLTGKILRKAEDSVIIDVGGVGYLVSVPLSTLGSLPEAGGDASLLIHTHLREDAIHLYGFATDVEKNLFLVLVGVSGIGPKLALSVLSGLPAADLIAAIRGSEESRLCALPGIGRKTAARICLELKDKIRHLLPEAAAPQRPARVADGTVEDAVSALVNLGYKRASAEDAVQKAARARSGLRVEELIREALGELSRK
jgi:Holliday junction DNA helicase RuvA